MAWDFGALSGFRRLRRSSPQAVSPLRASIRAMGAGQWLTVLLGTAAAYLIIFAYGAVA